VAGAGKLGQVPLDPPDQGLDAIGDGNLLALASPIAHPLLGEH